MASADQATAVGYTADATAQFSSAFGTAAQATAFQSTAVGNAANASGLQSVAVGQGSIAASQQSTVLGVNANTDPAATGATVIGFNSQVNGLNGTTLGTNSSANFANSTALGNGAATTRADQISIGTGTNTLTASGITSLASRSAQVGPLQIVTSDQDGNLATDTPASLGLASQADVDENRQGIAGAYAISGIPNIVPEGKNFIGSINWGGFEGANALATGGAVRLFTTSSGSQIFANGAVAFGLDDSATGGRAGFSMTW